MGNQGFLYTDGWCTCHALFCLALQSYAKWTHSQVVVQLAFVFISRVSVGFWFEGRFLWLISAWCQFLLGVFKQTWLKIMNHLTFRAYNQIIFNVSGITEFNWLAARSHDRGFTVKCAKPWSWHCDITSKNFKYVLNATSFP